MNDKRRIPLTSLSADHKSPIENDPSLERLLLMDGTILEVGGGYWVDIKAKLVTPSGQRPAGVSYSLCLYHPESGERVICFDNAHPISTGSGPAKKQTEVNDHLHKGETIKPYPYTTAEELMVAFWEEVYGLLKKEGVS